MELYFKNKDGALVETTLREILSEVLSSSGFDLDNYIGVDGTCVGIVQKNHVKPSQVVVNLCFGKGKPNEITDVNVYETPIKTIVDDDETKQLI